MACVVTTGSPSSKSSHVHLFHVDAVDGKY